MLDTREGAGQRVAAGGVVTLDADALGVTSGTTGVMLNLTVTDTLGARFLTAFPCATGRPTTSNLNFAAGDVVANFVIVQPDADGNVLRVRPRVPRLVDLMGTLSDGFTGARRSSARPAVANLPTELALSLQSRPARSISAGTVRE